MSIVRIRYYTEAVIQIFKTYTESRICCYVAIISRIFTDSYGMNKREYGLHVFIESLYNDIQESYLKNIHEILFCILLYFVQILENTVQKKPVLTVALFSV